MTTLLKRVIAEKRGLVLPLAIALLANIVAYAFVVHPRGVKAAGAADRAAAATAELGVAEREYSVARTLVSGKARADEELSAFYEKVLPASHEAARRLTYALPALAQKSGVRWARSTSEIDQVTQKGEKVRHLLISMVLQGDYQDFRAFMYALERAPDFLIIDDVQLTESNANEPLTLVLRMSTYFRLNTNGT